MIGGSFMNLVRQLAINNTAQRRAVLESLLDVLGVNYVEDSRVAPINVIVDIGNQNENAIMFSAHYDVFSVSTGANDNASSLSVLLKLLSYFKDHNEDNKHYRFVFFDLEEQRGAGSRAYIQRHGVNDIAAVINLDVVGVGDYVCVYPYSYQNNSVIRGFLNNDVINNNHVKVLRDMPPGDDRTFCHLVPTLTISVLTDEDIEALYSHHFLSMPVLQTMHCVSSRDCLESVQQSALDKTYHYLVDVINHQ